VYYQPIIDLFTGAIAGFEALARWRHPTRGLLGPVSFIPFAEESDLINKIDSFVLAQACSQARRWQIEHGSGLAISVNLSSRRLIDARLADDVAFVLGDSNLDPSTLILEITESAAMRDTELAARNLEALKTFGVRIALDDFGTGYSSLSYLEQLPIDILKIDRSFVSAIREGRSDVGLAPAIVQLAQTLGHTPIAEGVENAAQAETLRRLGCRLAQGYHLAMPQDASDISRLLKKSQVSTIPNKEQSPELNELTETSVVFSQR
jgi:EAL domain-containing protein (putative c-di-GMP-specific phosphodiesterase class I)